jgi:hypothetical protein
MGFYVGNLYIYICTIRILFKFIPVNLLAGYSGISHIKTKIMIRSWSLHLNKISNIMFKLGMHVL